jgi:hypothetical protein
VNTILEARSGRKTDRKGQMAAMELDRLSYALRAGDKRAVAPVDQVLRNTKRIGYA